ncbi:AAA family ATPase [Cellulomonas phragmiteti]|nr:ATP-binding protein [Cellulomonas phragmiteti]
MLVRFEAENFRSIAEAVTLSMVAVDHDREAAREQPLLDEHLLTVAGVYGPNASGKSNVLAALGWLRDAVRDSLRVWEDEIPVEPFAFGTWGARPSRFVVEATIDGVRVDYELEVSRDRVLYEALFEYPERRRRRIFERDGEDLSLARGLGSLAGARGLLTPRTLALSAMRRFDEERVGAFASRLLRMQAFGLRGPQGNRTRAFAAAAWASSTARLFDVEAQQQSLFDATGTDAVEPDMRQRALGLLRLADLGIDDVAFIDEPLLMPDGGTRSRRRPQLVHNAGGVRVPFELTAESEGTRAWFSLIGPTLTALDRGGLVVVDELDASLHPSLSVELLRLFRDRATNPHDAQLLFTSHDATLLNSLNRDEVWLTEKDADGSTRLGALSDFAGERVRRSQNLESAYLKGRFGGLPDVDRAGLLHALGLVG